MNNPNLCISHVSEIPFTSSKTYSDVRKTDHKEIPFALFLKLSHFHHL